MGRPMSTTTAPSAAQATQAPGSSSASSTTAPIATAAVEIRRSLGLLHEPGTVFEIRALGVPSENGKILYPDITIGHTWTRRRSTSLS